MGKVPCWLNSTTQNRNCIQNPNKTLKITCFHISSSHDLMSCCNAIKVRNTPPVDQIIIWLPSSIRSTNPYVLLRKPTIIHRKVLSSLSQILQPGLPSLVSLIGSCSFWEAPCRHWLLSSHFSVKWIRIPAWACFRYLLDRNLTLDL